MEKKFNATKYKQKYNEEHYKIFKVSLKYEDNEKLDNFLKNMKLTKAEFLRRTINDLEKNIDTYK